MNDVIAFRGLKIHAISRFPENVLRLWAWLLLEQVWSSKTFVMFDYWEYRYIVIVMVSTRTLFDMMWHRLFLVSAMFSAFSIFLSQITKHRFHRMCQSIFLEESCGFLRGFRKALMQILIRALRASIEQINAHSRIVVYLISSYHPELDVMFVSLHA